MYPFVRTSRQFLYYSRNQPVCAVNRKWRSNSPLTEKESVVFPRNRRSRWNRNSRKFVVPSSRTSTREFERFTDIQASVLCIIFFLLFFLLNTSSGKVLSNLNFLLCHGSVSPKTTIARSRNVRWFLKRNACFVSLYFIFSILCSRMSDVSLFIFFLLRQWLTLFFG